MDRGAWWATQSMGLQRVRHNWATNTLSFKFICIPEKQNLWLSRASFHKNMGVEKKMKGWEQIYFQSIWKIVGGQESSLHHHPLFPSLSPSFPALIMHS